MSMNGGYRLEDSFDYTFLTGCMKPALITEDYHQLFSTHVPSISAKKRGSGSKIVCLDDLSDKKGIYIMLRNTIRMIPKCMESME